MEGEECLQHELSLSLNYLYSLVKRCFVLTETALDRLKEQLQNSSLVRLP